MLGRGHKGSPNKSVIFMKFIGQVGRPVRNLGVGVGVVGLGGKGFRELVAKLNSTP